jgi:hypothetical protein
MSMRLCHGRPHNANTMSSNHRNECLDIHMSIVHSLTCGLDTREMSPISVSSGPLATRGRYVVRTELGRCSFGRAEELDDNDMPGGPSTRGTKNAHPARTHRAPTAHSKYGVMWPGGHVELHFIHVALGTSGSSMSCWTHVNHLITCVAKLLRNLPTHLYATNPDGFR